MKRATRNQADVGSSITDPESDVEDDATVEYENCPEYVINPIRKLKWQVRCRKPDKPIVTREIVYDKVNIENGTAFEVFSKTCSFDELVDLTVLETNRYALQKGEEFSTTADELKAFFGLTNTDGLPLLAIP